MYLRIMAGLLDKGVVTILGKEKGAKPRRQFDKAYLR